MISTSSRNLVIRLPTMARWAMGFLCALFAALLLITGWYSGQSNSIAVLLIITSVATVVFLRGNVVLFVISLIIAYANYSACMANVWPPYSGYDTMYADSYLSTWGLCILLLFQSVLLIMLPQHIKPFRISGFWKRWSGNKWSATLVCFIALALIIIFFTCSTGFNRVTDTNRANNNQIYEYSYVLFIFAFMFAGDNKWLSRLLTTVACLYIAQAFFGGNRASVLAIAMLLFLIYLAPRATWQSTLIVTLFGILLMVAMGYYRSSDTFFLFAIPETLARSLESSFIWDTASFAFHQSIAYLRLDEVVSSAEHIRLTFRWIGSWFVGTGLVPDSRLSTYSTQFFPGLGGGFLPMYGYFYLGVPGVFLSAFVVGMWFRVINGLDKNTPTLRYLLAITIAITFCRWYLYSPSPLTTGCMFAIYLYVIMQLLAPKLSNRAPGTPKTSASSSKTGSISQ